MNSLHDLRVLVFLTFFVGAPPLAQAQQSVPGGPGAASADALQAAAPAPAQRIQLPGLPRFGKISEQLYRGGQPEHEGLDELKKLGMDIIVNLRDGEDEIARERALVEAQGMQYVSIPWRGKEDPRPRQVAEFLELLRSSPGKKVFVHCERGAERTGVMVACYRIGMEKWTSKQALDEMEVFGFRGWRFGHLKRFVRGFSSLLATDPFLKKLGIGS
jgi:protein tyrosine/serine phosphatase